MPRLLDWPRDLAPLSQEPLSGPSSISAGGQPSLTGYQQTVSSPFGLWVWKLEFPPMVGRTFREFRGWFVAMHNGANATRWSINDPDRLSWRESGVPVDDDMQSVYDRKVPWSNNRSWSNGNNWEISRPVVPVSTAIARGQTQARFDDVFWGRKLGVGEMFGFGPFHFGLYIVTVADLDGSIRFWPPLRKEVAVGNHVTLNPTLAVRMMPNSGGGLKRDGDIAQGMQITFMEVENEDVARFYTR